MFKSIYGYFFPAFDPNKCKLYLRSAMIRLLLHKSKNTENIKRQRKEIINMINTEKEDMAQIQVEQILRSEKLIQAYEIVELFCELLQAKMGVLEFSDDIPHDLREAACSVIWASLRVKIPELKQVVGQLKLKFGEEFVEQAMENHNDCVNGQLMEKLSIEIPDIEQVQDYLLELSPIDDNYEEEEEEEEDEHFGEESSPTTPSESYPPNNVPFNTSVPYGTHGISPSSSNSGGLNPSIYDMQIGKGIEGSQSTHHTFGTEEQTTFPEEPEVDFDSLAARFEALKRGL